MELLRFINGALVVEITFVVNLLNLRLCYQHFINYVQKLTIKQIIIKLTKLELKPIRKQLRHTIYHRTHNSLMKRKLSLILRNLTCIINQIQIAINMIHVLSRSRLKTKEIYNRLQVSIKIIL